MAARYGTERREEPGVRIESVELAGLDQQGDESLGKSGAVHTNIANFPPFLLTFPR
jgi:hypothetical protein